LSRSELYQKIELKIDKNIYMNNKNKLVLNFVNSCYTQIIKKNHVFNCK